MGNFQQKCHVNIEPDWRCQNCVFPFNDVDDDEFVYLNCNLDISESKFMLVQKCNNLKSMIDNKIHDKNHDYVYNADVDANDCNIDFDIMINKINHR